MTGVYANTTNISDTAQIDASDVKTPIDALDTQMAKYRFAGGRLTLSSTQAVPTSDISGAGTLYYLEYGGAAGSGLISLWDAAAGASGGIKTIDFTSATVSKSLTGTNSLALYDIFGYLSSGVLALELLLWTNSGIGTSSRATALTWQNGMLCKDGDPTRRFLGTIYISALSGNYLTEDTTGYRYLSNVHNQVPRSLLIADATASWTYGTATWRESRATNNSVFFIAPLDGNYAMATMMQAVGGTTISVNTGVGYDSVTPTYFTARDGSGIQTLTSSAVAASVAGRHKFTSCENVGTGTATFYGGSDTHLLSGFVMA